MAYTKQTWTDGVNGGTPITAARLQTIENGIAAAAQFLGTGTAFPTTGIGAGDFFWRSDLGTNGSLWQYTGNAAVGLTGWLRRGPGDTTLGEASGAIAASSDPVITGTAGAWTDLAAVTATSYGGTVAVRWLADVFNAGSGVDRNATFQVVCDSTVLGNTGTFNVPIGPNTSAGNGPRITRGGTLTHTPAAGSHTWKIQANCAAASAVMSQLASLVVVEK